MDKMIWEGKEYELAKHTMKIARLIETAEKSSTVQDAYRNELELVKAALGTEITTEILETTNIEEVDLTTLVMVYNCIADGYEKRIEDMQKAKEEAVINSPAVKAVSNMASDVKVITSAAPGGKRR